jgi:hypothetical protein
VPMRSTPSPAGMGVELGAVVGTGVGTSQPASATTATPTRSPIAARDGNTKAPFG